jgi:hypothetical protein
MVGLNQQIKKSGMKKTLLIAITVLITGIANGQVTNGLVAKYSFNSGNANDEVGTNHGTVNGANLTTDRFGNANKAYNFINGDNITLPNAAVLKSANMTVSLWVKVDSFCVSNVGTNYIYSIVNSTTNAYFATLCLSVYTSNSKYLSVSQNGPTESTLGFSANAAPTGWQHYVIAIDHDSMRMYIGGQKEWSIYKGFALNYTSDSIYIGQSGNNTYPGNLNGSVDDIKVYKRVLNAAEVDSLFKESNPVSVGIKEGAPASAVSFYPNPTRGHITLSDNCSISIMDITGKLVIEAQNTNNIDLTAQPTGIYFITLTNAKGELIQRSKLIKE